MSEDKGKVECSRQVHAFFSKKKFKITRKKKKCVKNSSSPSKVLLYAFHSKNQFMSAEI